MVPSEARVETSSSHLCSEELLKERPEGNYPHCHYKTTSREPKYLKQWNSVYQVPWKVASEKETKLVWMKQGNLLVLWQTEVEEGRTTKGKESLCLSGSFLAPVPRNPQTFIHWQDG